MRSAGTRDILLRGLHLEKGLLKQQDTQKHGQVTKNNCVRVQLGQISNKKIQKGHKPTPISEVGSQSWELRMMPTHSATEGWADHRGAAVAPLNLLPCCYPAYGPEQGRGMHFSSLKPGPL